MESWKKKIYLKIFQRKKKGGGEWYRKINGILSFQYLMQEASIVDS